MNTINLMITENNTTNFLNKVDDLIKSSNRTTEINLIRSYEELQNKNSYLLDQDQIYFLAENKTKLTEEAFTESLLNRSPIH